MSLIPTKGEANPRQHSGSFLAVWLPGLSWGVAALMVALLAFMLLQRAGLVAQAARSVPEPTQTTADLQVYTSLPVLKESSPAVSLLRQTLPHTTIPERSSVDVVDYTVTQGDSIFGIAKDYKLKPESVLWANYDQLQDNPQQIFIGTVLKIPPVDGIYYKWKKGDTLQSVADQFKVKVDGILTWPGNNIDLVDPKIAAGIYVMIPGGWRPTQTWVVPTIWRANSGANKSINGGCNVTGGAFGSGYFVWPADNHHLSGNDFWAGHLGLDLAAGLGANVYAADSGVVVYAAPINGGYGNLIMIDHGNGFTTVYGHLSQFLVACGQSVSRGQRIALAGSTGNSTGAHLHFEIRQFGAFINPWQVLP